MDGMGYLYGVLTDLLMSIADNIKRLREQKGVVQNEVAAEMVLGVPKSPALAHPKLMRKRY
jgi:hypothetical protein